MARPGPLTDFTIATRWKVGKRIGGGSFGEVYIGKNIKTGELVGIKAESVRARFPQLIYEARLLKYLQGGDGICKVYHCCTEHDFHLMVMELLGSSLEDVFTAHNRHFSIETICQIGIQMLHRVEYLHTKSFIHRDIKPDNFLIGQKEAKGKVHMIDLGLAKKYRDPRTGTHIVYRDNKNLTGTARYASINAHLGVEQSRRDDLEAVGYVLLYFAKNGMLPWQGIQAENKQEKYQRIMEKKMCLPVDVLCRGCPGEFSVYLYYCRALRFEDQPDYQYLRGHFKRLLDRRCSGVEPPLDWINDSDDPARQNSFTGVPGGGGGSNGRPEAAKRDVSRQNTSGSNRQQQQTPPVNVRVQSANNNGNGQFNSSSRNRQEQSPRLSQNEVRGRSADYSMQPHGSHHNNTTGRNRRQSGGADDDFESSDDDSNEDIPIPNTNNTLSNRKGRALDPSSGRGQDFDEDDDDDDDADNTGPRGDKSNNQGVNSQFNNKPEVALTAQQQLQQQQQMQRQMKRAGFFSSLGRMCGCGGGDERRTSVPSRASQHPNPAAVPSQPAAMESKNKNFNNSNNNNNNLGSSDDEDAPTRHPSRQHHSHSAAANGNHTHNVNNNNGTVFRSASGNNLALPPVSGNGMGMGSNRFSSNRSQQHQQSVDVMRRRGEMEETN
eukprot:GDKK01029132.1.p1 GENE.GDKK01029132.1~~GDKK01029132.1.p1  ORF type:complete len:662 (+),score=155.29 GDKK01029132.1:99-2084(+)